MKVFFFTKSLAAGGAETQSTVIASGLKFKGYDVEFIVYSKLKADSNNLDRLVAAKIPIHELLWKRPLDMFRMYRLFCSSREGVLFTFTAFPDFIGGCVAKLAGMRRIYAGIRSENLPGFHMKMERFLNRFIVTKTVFNSYRGRDNFLKLGFDPDKTIVVSNAVEMTNKVKCFSMPLSNCVRIVTVGRFIESKDYRSWLEVFAKVRDKNPYVRGIIIGYGELESQIRNWIRECGLSEVVEIILGNNGVDIAAELAYSDIYFTTTLREGCCNTILEAMRAGLPIVATDVGDNAYMVRNGVNGYVAELRDVDKLAQCVCKLVNDKSKREAFGRASKKIVAEEYSPRIVFQKYEELLG